MFNKISVRSALLVAVLVVLVAGLFIVQGPLASSIESLKSTKSALSSDITTAQTKVEKMASMQKKIEEIKASGDTVNPLTDYDDVNAVIDELNAIFGDASGYTITFDDAEISGLVASRPITVKFQTSSYDEAVQKLNSLKSAEHRFFISGISISRGTSHTSDTTVWTTSANLYEFEMKA